MVQEKRAAQNREQNLAEHPGQGAPPQTVHGVRQGAATLERRFCYRDLAQGVGNGLLGGAVCIVYMVQDAALQIAYPWVVFAMAGIPSGLLQ